MRCFVAVDLADSLKDKIVELQKEIAGDVKLVEPQNLHFTMKFLGETDETTIAEVKSIVKKAAFGFSVFDANVGGIGVFPNTNYIRVIWLGCSDLLPLQTAIEESLWPLFKKEPSIPHLTLARVRSPIEITAFLEKHSAINIGTMSVNEVKLKKSTLSRQGPIYEDLEVFPLR